jgi:hypothetical protein
MLHDLRDYCERRISEELSAAEDAANPEAKLAHQALAQQYKAKLRQIHGEVHLEALAPKL